MFYSHVLNLWYKLPHAPKGKSYFILLLAACIFVCLMLNVYVIVISLFTLILNFRNV